MPVPNFSWDEVAKLRPVSSVPPDAFTMEDYRKQFPSSPTTARRELAVMVEAGGLVTAVDRRDGHLVRVYWRAR